VPSEAHDDWILGDLVGSQVKPKATKQEFMHILITLSVNGHYVWWLSYCACVVWFFSFSIAPFESEGNLSIWNASSLALKGHCLSAFVEMDWPYSYLFHLYKCLFERSIIWIWWSALPARFSICDILRTQCKSMLHTLTSRFTSIGWGDTWSFAISLGMWKPFMFFGRWMLDAQSYALDHELTHLDYIFKFCFLGCMKC